MDVYSNFFVSKYIPEKLIEVPFLTEEFKNELAKQDIYTAYQLIGLYAKFHFNYEICQKLVMHTPEKLIHTLFLHLMSAGFKISFSTCDISDYIIESEEETEVESNDNSVESHDDNDEFDLVLEYYQEKNYM